MNELNELLNSLSVWSTTRAAGMTAYLLLFLSTAAGLLMSMKLLGGRTRSIIHSLHQSSGWFGFLFGFLHGLVLVFDKYVGYSPSELLIPFTAHDHTVLNGIGTITFYMMFLLILSSDLMKRLGKKVWRSIHFLAFPGFFLALIHGFALGTDTQTAWVKAVYLITAGLVILLTVLRVAMSNSGSRKLESSRPCSLEIVYNGKEVER